MNNPLTTLILCGALLALTLLSGLWVTHLGRPLNGWVFTLHKLVALAAGVVIAVRLYPVYQALDSRTALQLAAVLVAVVVFISLVATGGRLSFETPAPRLVLALHQVGAALAVLSGAGLVYLFGFLKF